MIDLSLYSFLWLPLLTGIAASFTGGIIGSYVVTKRIVFIAGSISHSVFGGMGIFLWLERTYDLSFVTPLSGAFLSAIVSACILGVTHLHYKEREDSVIAALWAAGMSVGIIFIAYTPGYNVELMNFLFGNILWVTKSDLWALILLDSIVITCTLIFYRKFQAICFDEEHAYLQGIPTKALYILLLCLIAISVVLLIRIAGAVLVISLLTLPAAIAGGLTSTLSSMMKIATSIGILLVCLGIYLSYQLNWPPGATITLLATLCYVPILFRLSDRIRRRLSGSG